MQVCAVYSARDMGRFGIRSNIFSDSSLPMQTLGGAPSLGHNKQKQPQASKQPQPQVSELSENTSEGGEIQEMSLRDIDLLIDRSRADAMRLSRQGKETQAKEQLKIAEKWRNIQNERKSSKSSEVGNLKSGGSMLTNSGATDVKSKQPPTYKQTARKSTGGRFPNRNLQQGNSPTAHQPDHSIRDTIQVVDGDSDSNEDLPLTLLLQQHSPTATEMQQSHSVPAVSNT